MMAGEDHLLILEFVIQDFHAGVGRIQDIPTVAELIDRIVSEAEAALRESLGRMTADQ